jgi:hypothetical protein
LLQTAALLDWDPDAYLELVTPPSPDPSELVSGAMGVGAERGERLLSALLDRLSEW